VGEFSYNVPVGNGAYNVTLKFAEIYSGINDPGKRLFSVFIEGKEVLSNLDLFSKVGRFTAYDQTIPVNVTDGVLNIEFRSIADSAKVNAILVTQASTPIFNIPITAQPGTGGIITPSGAVTVAREGARPSA